MVKVKSYPKNKPERSKAYRQWIRSKPCLICGYTMNDSFPDEYGVDPHHESEKGHGTMGGKTTDKRCVPLCSIHHTYSTNSRHNTSREEFWQDIDIEAIILEYNREWEELQNE
ncbi:MAG: DUF968 domain-containing protein [Desulfobacteraceae bacterium]|nr:DUF968 domain-containing protein [Desulfobacteraceae bacterium]